MIMPYSTTYQTTAFSMGIVLAHPNLKNLYYNHYISFGCVATDEIDQLELDFTNVGIGDYTKQELGEMNLYHFTNISKSYAERFIKERIDQGNYILLFMIDEFYLSYSTRYQKENFVHDSYLYGYDEDFFMVMAYSAGNLQMMKIPSQQIIDGLYSYMQTDPDSYFCTFRPSAKAVIEIDHAKIIKDICDYGEGSIDLLENRIYGIDIYQPLLNCIRKIQQDPKLLDLDLRPFRVLWEHKQSLRRHIDILHDKVDLPIKIKEEIMECEYLSEQIFMLAIKYNIAKDKKNLKKIIASVTKLNEIEKEALEQFKTQQHFEDTIIKGTV
jgi:hypothetical protein